MKVMWFVLGLAYYIVVASSTVQLFAFTIGRTLANGEAIMVGLLWPLGLLIVGLSGIIRWWTGVG